MPELPETETIARDLDRAIRGARVVEVAVRRRDVLREVSAKKLAARLVGAVVERCWRRAKLVIIDFSTGDRLVVQPRFTGALIIDDGAMDERDRRYSTLDLRFHDGRQLHYRDIRRLGTVALMDGPRFAACTASLGIEPLDPAFTANELSARLQRSRQPVKKVLMDQRVVTGIGNIYANEALWRAGVDPSRAARSITASEAERIHAAVVGVLGEAIEARGTSFRDYRDARGERGGFVDQLAVYGHAGDPCPRCGARLVGTHAIDGRMTVLCAHCQS